VSLICHPTQVNGTRLNLSQKGRYSIYPPRRDGRLSWPRRLVTYWDGLPARRQSPIQVLTRTGVANFLDCIERVTATPSQKCELGALSTVLKRKRVLVSCLETWGQITESPSDKPIWFNKNMPGYWGAGPPAPHRLHHCKPPWKTNNTSMQFQHTMRPSALEFQVPNGRLTRCVLSKRG